MRIAIIGHKRIPSSEGGIEKGVEAHAVRMVRRGHTVEVYNRSGSNIYGKEYDGEQQGKVYKGIRLITVPTPHGGAEVPVYSFLATIRALFGHYDVISYRASGSCVMIPLAKLFHIRCVASIHGFDSERAKWGKFARWYLEHGERFAAKHADACLVFSENMKRMIRERYGTEAICIANGIDKPELCELDEMKKRYQLEKDQYILFLSRITQEKGIHYLIKAFRQINTTKKLVIAGGCISEEYMQELKQLAAGDDRIVFTGFVQGKAIAELYSNAYFFTMPSDLEGMANAMLEAMAYGNCCLLSDIPENTEVTEDHAVYFRHSDVADLAAQMQRLVDDPAVVAQYRETAAPFILNKCNWDTIVDELLEIYQGDKE